MPDSVWRIKLRFGIAFDQSNQFNRQCLLKRRENHYGHHPHHTAARWQGPHGRQGDQRYANKKIEELDTRRQTISKAIADLSVETISPQQIKKLSYYLDNWESIDFDDKRKAADGLISTIKATSDRVQIEWKI